MKTVIYSILSIILFISCHKEITTIPPPLSDEYVELSIAFKCKEIEATRALSSSQESQVKDVNIYLFHRSSGIVKHQFTTISNLSINVIAGEYDIYTIANIGYDMGAKTKVELDNFSTSITTQYDIERNSVLVMSSHQSAIISTNTKLSIVLKRVVAKVNVSVTVKDGFDFNLQSMQIINAPSGCRLFQPNSSKGSINYSSVSSFYMYENLQGVNNSITTEQQKNHDRAPRDATYIHFVGTSDGNKVEYFVYLGENNTTDFNIYRNKNYTYNIYIRGVNEVDSRVNIVTLTVDDIVEEYHVGESFMSAVHLNCVQNMGSNYYLLFSLIEGSGQVINNNHVIDYDNYALLLSSGLTSSSFPFQYVQSGSSKVRLLISVKDDNGVVFSRELGTNYVKPNNPLTITSVTSTESRGGGKSLLTFFVQKRDYIGAVELKYELLSGSGIMKHKGAIMVDGVYGDATLGNNSLEFTPTEPMDAKIRITIKLANGETQTVEHTIIVLKTIVTITRTNGNGIIYHVDDPQWYDSSQRKYILPINFGSSIGLRVPYKIYNSSDGSSTYNRYLADCEVKPGELLRLTQIGRKPNYIVTEVYWDGILEIKEGNTITTFDLIVKPNPVTPNKFFELIVNQ